MSKSRKRSRCQSRCQFPPLPTSKGKDTGMAGYQVASLRRYGDSDWRAYIVDAAGSRPPRRKRIKASNEDEAQAAAKKMAEELDRSWTVGLALERTLESTEEKVSPQTQSGYRTIARALSPFSEREVDSLSASEVEAFLDSSGRSATGRKKVLEMLRRASDTAVACGGARKNPCDGVRPIARSLRPEAHVDLETLESRLKGAKGRACVLLGLVAECGLSVSEAAALERVSKRLVIAHSVGRKVGGAASLRTLKRPRCVILPDWLAAKAKEMHEGFCGTYAFGSGDEPGNVDALCRSCNRLLDAFGFDCTVSEVRAASRSREHRLVDGGDER